MSEEKKEKVGRRSFLKGTLQALVVAPAAAAAMEPNITARGEDTLWEENGKPLPGEPGYRDPDVYGSVSDDLAE